VKSIALVVIAIETRRGLIVAGPCERAEARLVVRWLRRGGAREVGALPSGTVIDRRYALWALKFPEAA